MDWIGEDFEWDVLKEAANLLKHKVDFATAGRVFDDPRRVIAQDVDHSGQERRYYCFGMVGSGVLTVRFTWRDRRIRIIGAGYWREGRALYEEGNQIHE